ncbi:KIR protein, partial [Plasmodium coatneyi]
MADEVSTKGLHCSIDRTTLKGYKSVLKGALLGKHYDADIVDGILHVWCCVSDIRGWESSKDERCDLLYYLAGAITYEKLQNKDDFGTIMNGLPNVLKTYFSNLEGCSIKENNNGEKFFAKMKLLGKYNLGPAEILEGQGDSSNVSCERCKKYLEEVMRAYGIVKGYCDLSTNITNCEGVRDGYRNKNPQDLYEAMYGKVELQRPEVLSEENCEQERLSSRQIYCQFQEALDQYKDEVSNMEDIKTAIDGILTSYGNHSYYGELSAKAFCLASQKKEKQKASSEDKYCTSLYYWLGDQLFSTMNNSTEFSKAMSEVYNKLEQLKGLETEGKCEVMYPNDNINLETFNHMKPILDYYHDYTTIKKCVDDPQASEPKCTTEYERYLKEVLSAYDYMSIKCPKEDVSNNKEWCTDFKKMTATHSREELLKLKCSLKHTSDCPSNAVAAAISGTLATTIGLPVIGYALYKYDFLPPWIKNTFFGNTFGRNSNTRNRRSTKHHFDTFTEDSLTYDSTETTTRGSTIDDDRTEYSAPYTATASSREAGREQQQRRRKNISYHA